jgi:AraC-like DNA-binding protein
MITQFLAYMYTITNVPVHVYEGEKLLFQMPALGENYDPVPAYVPALRADKRPVNFLSTGEHHYYGIVKALDNSSYVVLGPLCCTLCASQVVGRMMADAHIPPEYEKEFGEFIQRIPNMKHLKFMNLLMLVYREMNHAVIAIEEIRDISNDSVSDAVLSNVAEETLDVNGDVDVAAYYEYEQTMMRSVEKGDVEQIKKDRNTKIFPPVGKLAATERRQANNVFIILAAAAARAAIKGGLDVKTALNVCNQYIRESEARSGITAMEQLYDPMLLDFAQKVSACKVPRELSADIYKCVQYVQQNVNRPIAVEDVSRNVGKSRSLVTKKFKQEMGISVNTYIVNCKLETARDFLRHTDKPISYISEYLYFSSQGYFQNLFRAKYGITPHKYRQYSKP